MRLPKTPPKRARIEIVPMIDAIFFLLVFFMYSSLSMVKMNGLPIALPQTNGASDDRRPGLSKDAPHLMVEIQSDGSCLVAGSRIAPDRVASTVRSLLEKKPESLVVVRAGKGSGIQGLVSTMDSLNTIRLSGDRTPTLLVATDAVTEPQKSLVGTGTQK